MSNDSLEPVSNWNSTSIGSSNIKCSQICSNTHLSNFVKAYATSNKVTRPIGGESSFKLWVFRPWSLCYQSPASYIFAVITKAYSILCIKSEKLLLELPPPQHTTSFGKTWQAQEKQHFKGERKKLSNTWINYLIKHYIIKKYVLKNTIFS